MGAEKMNELETLKEQNRQLIELVNVLVEANKKLQEEKFICLNITTGKPQLTI